MTRHVTTHPPGRITPGTVLMPRTLTSIRNEQVVIPAADALTHLQFRRFAGCPVCAVHLRSFTQRHDEITAAGVREVVVFHSSAESMRPHQGDLPFAAIADPARRLYQEFGVEFSLRSVLNPRALISPFTRYPWTVARREWQANRSRLTIRDGMTGHPADFLIAPDGRVLAAHYGEHANDQWSVDQVLELARGR